MQDAQLRYEVQDELEWEPIVNASEIGVTAHDGVVTLTGLVRSYTEKLAAARAAKRVQGVKAVANDIELRLPGATTDAEIAGAAFDALKRQSSVPHDRIDVMVSDGWIYLQGEVDSQYQKSAAQQAVHSLVGVKGVMQQINVKPKDSAPESSAPESNSDMNENSHVAEYKPQRFDRERRRPPS